MPRLTTHRDLQRVRDPGFCYLCGREWGPMDRRRGMRTRDHVPPAALFSQGDRQPPLILLTHPDCNSGLSPYDQQIAQFVSLLWRDSPTPEDVSALDFALHQVEGRRPLASVEWLNIGMIVARWVRAFHAALYGDFLPQVEGRIHEPLPGGNTPGEDTTLRPDRLPLTSILKANWQARNVDCIIVFNGQCRYFCFWSNEQGTAVCKFALDVYAWHQLGDLDFPSRSCVGWYKCPRGIPMNATHQARLAFRVRNSRPLDAFEE